MTDERAEGHRGPPLGFRRERHVVCWEGKGRALVQVVRGYAFASGESMRERGARARYRGAMREGGKAPATLQVHSARARLFFLHTVHSYEG